MRQGNTKGCRLIVPDGSLKEVVAKLLADAGLAVSYPDGDRSYRGLISNGRLFPPPFNIVRRMRPWDSPWVVADDKADLAFSGEDLICEAGCEDKVVIVDRYPLSRAGVGKTRLVVAVPKKSRIKRVSDLQPQHELVTEHPNFAARWLNEQGVHPRIRTCHGSLEAFADIADAIFETVESGLSLKVAGFRTIAEVMESQCCLIANQAALDNPRQRAIIEEIRLLLAAVIDGRQKCLLKCNVLNGRVKLSRILSILPAADSPTVSDLANDAGFAVEAVVSADRAKTLIAQLKAEGATSIIIMPISHWAK